MKSLLCLGLVVCVVVGCSEPIKACPLVAVPQVSAIASVQSYAVAQSVAVAQPVCVQQVAVQSYAIQAIPVQIQTFAVQAQAVCVQAQAVCVQQRAKLLGGRSVSRSRAVSVSRSR